MEEKKKNKSEKAKNTQKRKIGGPSHSQQNKYSVNDYGAEDDLDDLLGARDYIQKQAGRNDLGANRLRHAKQ